MMENVRFKVGQVWMSRCGDRWTINCIATDLFNYGVFAQSDKGHNSSFTSSGREYTTKEAPNDLLTLIEPAPAPAIVLDEREFLDLVIAFGKAFLEVRRQA